MKIHIVTQTFPPRIGGMQTLMYSLAEGLSKKDYDVLVYPDHQFKTKNTIPKEERGLQVIPATRYHLVFGDHIQR